MTSEKVTLRRVTRADLDLFEKEFSSLEGTGPYQWFGFSDFSALNASLAENRLITDRGCMLTVMTDSDRVAGRVEWFEAAWGRSSTSSCWTIACGLIPSFWGRGIGTAAQALLAEYLFLHTRAERIQAFPDTNNRAEQRALDKAGFSAEGVIRSAQWRSGKWRDLILYSLLRSQRTTATVA